jgi:lipopolysaccharide export system protein LptA
MKYRFCAILALLVCTAGFCYAEGAPAERKKLPIQIKSNELLTDNATRTATFVGKVSARQGDVTIYSDKMIIYYLPNVNDVDRVEAFGSVRIVQENRLGEADHAIYDSKTGKVTLNGGNPKVVQGEDVVTGSVITYFVDEQKSVVTGAPGKRVDAIIHPKDKGKNDAKP